MTTRAELEVRTGGFNQRSFSYLADREANHFWFRARNQLIIWLLKKYAKKFDRFLEIGCGTGFVLEAISKRYPKASLSGGELYLEGLAFAKKRIPSANLFQLDATTLVAQEPLDCIGAFDVLEHIDQDEIVLTRIYEALAPAGLLIITVPQHPFLWSKADEVARHVRRYTASEVHRKLKTAGFRLLYSGSFVTLLFPLLIVSRMLKIKETKHDEGHGSIESNELEINPVLNWIFEQFMKLELLLIQSGCRLPIGGSRVVVCQKRCNQPNFQTSDCENVQLLKGTNPQWLEKD